MVVKWPHNKLCHISQVHFCLYSIDLPWMNKITMCLPLTFLKPRLASLWEWEQSSIFFSQFQPSPKLIHLFLFSLSSGFNNLNYLCLNCCTNPYFWMLKRSCSFNLKELFINDVTSFCRNSHPSPLHPCSMFMFLIPSTTFTCSNAHQMPLKHTHCYSLLQSFTKPLC